jgi:stearoyl-CoA desaturase (delta-9 desaturase)
MGPDSPTAVAAALTEPLRAAPAAGAPRVSGPAAVSRKTRAAAPTSSTRAVKMPLVDRLASAIVTGVPPLLVVLGMWLGWSHGLMVWQDLVVLAVFYVAIGSGVTVGFHRLLTHRSFKTHRVVWLGFAILGSMAAEGPVIDWVATHRKHHQFSDVDGDPHSPHLHHRHGFRGELWGLWHAHLGWVFSDMEVADERRYAKDLLADPWMRFVDKAFVLWVVLGLALAFGAGVALTGSIAGGLTAMLWGGAARIFFVHHATFSINSVCHYFGRREYETGDESRNVAWLAIPTWGEAWHNNHHAFPTSAAHGLRRRQLDPSWLLISGLARLGLASDVVAISADRRARKRCEL